MRIEEKEVIRYLGYGMTIPQEGILQLMDECRMELERVAEPKHHMRRFELTISDDSLIRAGGIELQSKSLAKNLQGCDEVIFFAATLGKGPDILLNRYSRLQITKALVLQAVGAAAIEAYCDQCQEDLEQQLLLEGLHLRPRYSPGYGDLSLDCQEDFLRALNAQRTLGILLSEGNLMIPEKSVSALIGICGEGYKVLTGGNNSCLGCTKNNCAFRRKV